MICKTANNRKLNDTLQTPVDNKRLLYESECMLAETFFEIQNFCSLSQTAKRWENSSLQI